MANIFADGASGWGAGIVAKGGGNMTDEELYRLYLAGDDAGLERLMERYGDALTLYIDGYLGDIHEAEDLMIEVFAYLLAKRPRIRDGAFKAYIYKAARHMALRCKSRRRPVFSLEDLSYAEAAEVMKKNEKQISNMVYRGKQSLRALLEKEGDHRCGAILSAPPPQSGAPPRSPAAAARSWQGLLYLPARRRAWPQ